MYSVFFLLHRFCEKDYYPFDPEDEHKYVVGDEYTQPWEVLQTLCFCNTVSPFLPMYTPDPFHIVIYLPL